MAHMSYSQFVGGRARLRLDIGFSYYSPSIGSMSFWLARNIDQSSYPQSTLREANMEPDKSGDSEMMALCTDNL